MTRMSPRRCVWLLAIVPIIAAACGGGTSEDMGLVQLTDPALAATATPMTNPVLFQIRGREIIVDGVSTAAATAPTVTPRSYSVLEGDTCGAIAEKLGVDLESLMEANRTINAGCTNLHAGDLLRVPGGANAGPTPTPRPGSGRTYIVKAGDSCSGIAQSFAVSLAELIAVNGLDAECQTLQPDQILTIP